jgi:hypothetical protein
MCTLRTMQKRGNPDAKVVMTASDGNFAAGWMNRTAVVPKLFEVTVNTQGHLALGTSGLLIWVRSLSVGCENAAS